MELRRRTRQDLEVTGNAYWEVLRNISGGVARLVYVPFYTMRRLPLDILYRQYDGRNQDNVGGAFRLPRLLRKDSREFNHSVADAQLRFAEDQVFQPERDEFDFIINRKLLAEIGLRF